MKYLETGKLRVLVACERSGAVREAFRSQGHEAWSCDFEISEQGGLYHFREDVRRVLDRDMRWNLILAFPPCTYLCSSGARWWSKRKKEQQDAIAFVRYFADLPVPRVGIENPIGILSSVWRKPDQIIQPHQFGHGETKATCLWLKGLPLLKPTKRVSGRAQRIHTLSPSPTRSMDRSRTYPGIAMAMAKQWGVA